MSVGTSRGRKEWLPDPIFYGGMVIQPHPRGFFVFNRNDTLISMDKPFLSLEEAIECIDKERK